MSKVTWCIVLGRETWQIARLDRSATELLSVEPWDEAQPSVAAQEMESALAGAGYQGERVMLALESTWCVSVTLEVPTARHARNRSAMTFLVETYLPWAAEESVNDYELRGTTALMVAVPQEPIASLVSDLEKSGVQIDSIVPLSRLALSDYLKKCQASQQHVLLWGSGEALELWHIDRGLPIEWQLLPLKAEEALRSVRHVALRQSDPVLVSTCDLPEPFPAELAAAGVAPLEMAYCNALVDAALTEARCVLTGRNEPALELRRDGLQVTDRHRAIRRELDFAFLAVLTLLLAVGFACWQRSAQFDSLRQAVDESHGKVHRRIFPNQPVPIGVRSRLEAEHSRLQSMRGPDRVLPSSPPAMDILLRVLRSVPGEFRFQFLELRIEHGQLYLVGQVRGHGDADRLATALRHTGLEVNAPNTHQLQSEGVEFRVAARLPLPSDKAH